MTRRFDWILALAGVALTGPAWANTPKASSELSDDEGKHGAALAFDGLLQTGWAEGELGDGTGAWLELRFDRPTDVRSVSIWPGNLGETNRVIREYGRPHTVTLSFDTGAGEPVTQQARVLDAGERGPLRVDVPVEVDGARSMKILLDQVYAGGIYNDTFIAEVAVNFLDGELPGQVEQVSEWIASPTGQRAVDDNKQAIVGQFEAITSAQFGDRDALDVLMDQAADGAPFLRKHVQSRVPAGFRMQALGPDLDAIEALLKIKDSNAIPAIERAALRSRGALQADLERRVQMFEAHQSLVMGGKRNVPPWGESGFAKGALQSFGEPLDLTVDSFGGVYVADVGNHRVQRFQIDTGIVDQVWGAGEPGMTDVWFYKTREFYAAGSQPGVGEGQFTNPVDLALIPDEKAGDEVLVLDAKGRITVIGPQGNVLKVHELPVEDPISPGAGGEGHILHAKKKVIVVWSNEGFVLDDETWEELAHFDIEDGAPTSAVAFKNGKLGLVYRDQLVMYSLDGFRHGDVMRGVLGEGFEDWSATLDESGKLWAILDTGELVKFKKPGKVDFRVQATSYSIDMPRVAVFDDLAFITTDDRVIRVDALELHAEQQVAEQEAAAQEAASGSGS